MKPFRYFQPTELRFGRGRLQEVGDLVRRFGDRCLLVTSSRATSRLAPVYARVHHLLQESGISVAHFDGVLPNPTTDLISDGARMAREHGANVVLGVGGGSTMDAAKAIAVEATHPGTAWDYLFFKQQPD